MFTACTIKLSSYKEQTSLRVFLKSGTKSAYKKNNSRPTEGMAFLKKDYCRAARYCVIAAIVLNIDPFSI